MVIVDDAVYIGSANFDIRSLFINVEMMVRIEDSAFADHARNLVMQMCEASRQITPELHKSRKSLLKPYPLGSILFYREHTGLHGDSPVQPGSHEA